MTRLSFAFIGFLLLAVACKESEKVTSRGLKYTVLKSGDGNKGEPGQVLVFNFQLKDSKDSLWNDSYKNELPVAMPIRDTSELAKEDDIIHMLHQLSPGDSVRTSVLASDFFKNFIRRPIPPDMDSTMSIIYIAKVVDIMSEEEFIPWRKKLTEERDSKLIKNYLADNKIDAKVDTSGIHYVIHSSAGGTKPTVENCVDVNYTGRFLKNGQVFDSNRVKFSLNRVIPGWQLAIPMLGKGDSATFYIPSGLAYGPMGPRMGLPADAILIFDVKLYDISEPDKQTGECK